MIALILGPTGAGKTGIMHRLMARHGLRYIKPFTTRSLREGESDKISISSEQFATLEADGKFIFVNRLFDIKYGTPRDDFEMALSSECVTHVLDFPLEAVDKLAQFAHSIRGIVVLPPSWKSLVKRLNNAGRADRVATARSQLEAYVALYLEQEHPIIGDRFVFNHHIDTAAQEVARILHIEAVQ